MQSVTEVRSPLRGGLDICVFVPVWVDILVVNLSSLKPGDEIAADTIMLSFDFGILEKSVFKRSAATGKPMYDSVVVDPAGRRL